MSSVGRLQAFDETTEDVESYFERIEAFFTANAVEAAHQVATLITVLGPKVYEELRTACRPQRPSEKTFQECKDILIARYRRPNLVLAERIRLRKREQRQGETIAQFASDLRHITNSCGFTGAQAAAEIESALKEAFVQNIRDVRIKKELITTDDLTFATALEKALKYELVYNQLDIEAESKSYGVSNMCAFSSNSCCWRCGYASHSANECRAKSWECYACGNIGHLAVMCKEGSRNAGRTTRQASGQRSDSEQRNSRWQRARGGSPERRRAGDQQHRRENDERPRSGATQQQQREASWRRQQQPATTGRDGDRRAETQRRGETEYRQQGETVNRDKLRKYNSYKKCNCVEDVLDNSDKESTDSGEPVNINVPTNYCNMLAVNSTELDKVKFTVDVIIQDKTLVMSIDTCSDLSLITFDEYRLKFSHLQLLKTKKKIRSYSGQPLELLGKILVNPIIDGKQYFELPLYVALIKIHRPPLLGCDWLKIVRIDWTKFQKQAYVCMVQNDPQINCDRKSHDNVVQTIKNNYPELISKDTSAIQRFEANIVLKEGACPVFRKAYSVPIALKPAVEREIERQVQLGILRPVKYSKWATPIVVVEKKNSTDVRVCGDFKRTLNPLTETDHYPLPTFEEMAINWAGCQFYSVVDLRGAYLQVKVNDNCCEMLTINTHKGLYQYNRMIYGWAGAPAEFQRIIEQVIKGIPGCCAYLDDVCVAGKTYDEALERLKLLLARLAEFKVKINLEKCQFLQQSVQYVGHTVSKSGILPLPSKFEAIKNTKPPTTKAELEKFLGLINYYMPHIPHLSTISRPLYELCNISGDQLDLSSQHKQAFTDCKTAFLSSKELMPFDSSRPIIVCTDASPVGTAGVLYQLDDEGKVV